MKERYTTPSAVMLILTRMGDKSEEILLGKRCGTGYMDGYYDLAAAGHTERGESLREAMRREAREELGIDIDESELDFVCLIHKNTDEGVYMNAFFRAKSYTGTPVINEKDKMSELIWCDINDLPERIIPDRVLAIQAYIDGEKYLEYGWD